MKVIFAMRRYFREPFASNRVSIVHSKITFSIARNVIMIGLLSDVETPGGVSTFGFMGLSLLASAKWYGLRRWL